MFNIFWKVSFRTILKKCPSEHNTQKVSFRTWEYVSFRTYLWSANIEEFTKLQLWPLKFCFSNMYYWIIAEQYVPSFIYWTSKDVLWGIRDFSWCSIPLEFRELCKDLCNFVLNSNNALLNYTFYVSIWFSNSCPTNVIFVYVTIS